MSKKKKKPDGSIKAMVKTGGLVTDREWPIYLFGLTKKEGEDWLIRKVGGYDLSAMTLDMLNAVTHKMSEWWKDELEETGEMPPKLNRAEFDELWLSSDGAIEVFIKESEIRKFLKKNYPKEFIYKHMKRIGHISLEGRAPVDWRQDHQDPLGQYVK
ncbi:MAG: hypothetical protein E3J56_11820 [Candidatus Aminicenantes bacterium]|nr:MAG: hypothetical protein E3J56_11820 [Candidatus Aminicenantes bacterium]